MPVKNSDKKTKSNRIANTGIYVSGGQIEQSDYDKKNLNELMQDYTDMRNDDTIASSSVDILMYPILNASFNIMPGYKEGEKSSDIAKECADYVMETYNQLDSGLNYYKRHKLLALYFGFAMFEKVWKMGDTINGKIGNRLKDLYPIQHDTIWKWEYDEKCNFTGIKQEQRKPEKGFTYVDIPVEYLHIFTPFEEFKNKQGRSLLRPSRLVWKIKTQVWKASGRASTRGAGIPEFKITPTGNQTTDATLKSTVETMGRNIGNSENAYVLTQEGVLEFTLHSLQNQEMNMQLIQQANTEMFYNTMSQFVTAGIGANGSRAATGEHKSPYFDALESIIQTFEENEDDLIREIVDNSPYANLEDYDMPFCQLERPKSTDIVQVGTLINSMIGRSITRTPDLEVFLRNMLGLPEKTEEEIEEIKIENEEEMQESTDGAQEKIEDTKETEIVEELHKLNNDGEWVTVNGRHVLIEDVQINDNLISAIKYKRGDSKKFNYTIYNGSDEIGNNKDKQIRITNNTEFISEELIKKRKESGYILVGQERYRFPGKKKWSSWYNGGFIWKKDNDYELTLSNNYNNQIELSINESVLELANATEVMTQADIKAEIIINEVYEKIIDDISIKLERNPNAEIKLAYKKEMIDRLAKVYNECYRPGQVDIRKEYAKIAGTQLASLTPIIVEGTQERLVTKVNTLYAAIENSIKDELLLINKQNIENAGGMRKYIVDRFGQTQKQIRTDLASIASGGYLAGRNDQLIELERIDPALRRTYNIALEDRENLCEVCRPLAFMTMDEGQAKVLGLNWNDTPVNPLCMGGNKCRCTWEPAYQISKEWRS